MNKKYYSLFIISLLFFVVIGCQTRKASIRSQSFQVQQYDGQIPMEVLSKASAQHGGSIETEPADPDLKHNDSIKVVLGPINTERMSDTGPISTDAGQIIREVIVQKFSEKERLTIVDAPEERYIEDSPRPDLAKRRIRLVIKGVTSQSSSAEKRTVFLRAVETASGKVFQVASSRADTLNDAAIQATNKLLDKILEDNNVPDN